MTRDEVIKELQKRKKKRIEKKPSCDIEGDWDLITERMEFLEYQIHKLKTELYRLEKKQKKSYKAANIIAYATRKMEEYNEELGIDASEYAWNLFEKLNR